MQKNGLTVYTWVGSIERHRRGRILPGRGEKWFYIRRKGLDFLLHWRAWDGIRVTAFGPAGRGGFEGHTLPDHEASHMPIKRRTVNPDTLPIPALSGDSKVLAKFPLIREFLTATQYEDGGARTPGYITLRNRVIEFEVSLYDPDAGSRIAIRSRTMDDAFAAAELILGAADAPWEPDRYLMEQLAKRNKSKKK